MKLSTENQELLDSIYPGGYEVKEKNVYHILFIKVFQTSGRHNTVHGMVQKFSGKDWAILKKQIDNGFKLGAITGYDELAIIHDPTVKEVVREAVEETKVKAKPGPKPAKVES